MSFYCPTSVEKVLSNEYQDRYTRAIRANDLFALNQSLEAHKAAIVRELAHARPASDIYLPVAQAKIRSFQEQLMAIVSHLNVKKPSSVTVIESNTARNVYYFTHPYGVKWRYTVFPFDAESNQPLDPIELNCSGFDFFNSPTTQYKDSLLIFKPVESSVRVFKLDDLMKGHPDIS